MIKKMPVPIHKLQAKLDQAIQERENNRERLGDISKRFENEGVFGKQRYILITEFWERQSNIAGLDQLISRLECQIQAARMRGAE